MLAWEIVYWLDMSWDQLVKTESLTDRVRSVLGVMRWQGEQEKRAALESIVKKSTNSEAFIRHCERILGINKDHQMRLELWK